MGSLKSQSVVRAVFTVLLCIGFSGAQAPDPLPSWNDGPAKRGIIDFVNRVTSVGGADFVPVEYRIATFDNDGTLWPEKPVIEGMFILERIKAMAEKDPSMKKKEPFKAALTGDTAYLKEAGMEAIEKLVAAAYSGMSQEVFISEATAFCRKATYPKIGLPVTAIQYQPMVELMAYLRTKQFRTWLCSGGTLEFMRVFSDTLYQIPPEQVIGTAVELKFQSSGAEKGRLMRQPGIAAVNDKEGKPVGISQHIGLRPIFAAGNVRTGGDIAMLTFSGSGVGPAYQLLINHDDDKREFAYREPDDASLKAAKAQGWTVVSMKKDWRKIFNALPEADRVGAKEAE